MEELKEIKNQMVKLADIVGELSIKLCVPFNSHKINYYNIDVMIRIVETKKHNRLYSFVQI